MENQIHDIAKVLKPNHLEDLRKSGLSDETICASGLYSEGNLDALRKMLNSRIYQKRMGDALVFPFFSHNGERVEFSRVKPTSPRVDKKKNKPIKYESPVGQPNRSYFPPGVVDAIRDSSRPLFFTEGEKKALAGTQNGYPTIGLIGVYGWKLKDDSKVDSLLIDLASITWKERLVYICFDSDRASNPNVLEAEFRLAAVLAAQGAVVRIIVLPNLADGSKAGLDDFLVSFGIDAFRMRVDEAQTPVQPSKQDALSRLESVLAAGAQFLFRDEELLEALAVESLDNKAAFAAHRADLRDAGVRLRDFDRALKPILLQEMNTRTPSLARDETGGLFIADGCLSRTKTNMDGMVIVALCNFVAQIVDETTRDDGLEIHIVFGIKLTLAAGREYPRFEVTASQFNDPDLWLPQNCGSDAIVWPGESRALGAAIQSVSRDPKTKTRRTTYCHTGWRKLGSGWVYLHGRGCISSAKLKPVVSVELQSPLDRFEFPDATANGDLQKAIRGSLSILKVAGPQITVPLLAAVYRSVFGDCDFSLFLAGLTGTGKSELAALAQQHWGAGLDSRHLPASWASTANSNEVLAFCAKDAVLVVDDFNPTGGLGEISRFHRDADRLLRAQGNSAGRGRMKADGTLRATKHPRGLILSTGEEVPEGHSLRARMLVLDVQRDSVDWDQMTRCQSDAAAGHFAQSLAGFIQYIASSLEEFQQRRKSFVVESRTEMTKPGLHARVPTLLAELWFGWKTFVRFAGKIGAISDANTSRLLSEGHSALIEAGRRQVESHLTSDPVQQFFQLLASALESGAAHLTDIAGELPSLSPATWGWRSSASGTGHWERMDWKPQGPKVGWINDGDIYLDPDASFSVVQKLADSHHRPIPLSPATLWRRVKDYVPPILASCDHERTTTKRTFGGVRKTVVHIRMDALTANDSATDLNGGAPDQNQELPQSPQLPQFSVDERDPYGGIY